VLGGPKPSYWQDLAEFRQASKTLIGRSICIKTEFSGFQISELSTEQQSLVACLTETITSPIRREGLSIAAGFPKILIAMKKIGKQ
jgi:hypothetical protein